jgi:hypothetical protein
MANPIDLIVTQDALKQVDISKLPLLERRTFVLGDQVLASSKNVSKINTPSV